MAAPSCMSPSAGRTACRWSRPPAPARAVSAEDTLYFRDISYTDGARRYDMGERDHFISMEMAAIGMEMMAGWGNDADRRRGSPC